jgi:uncharacterized protein with ParB-like and HNH nuclease domain
MNAFKSNIYKYLGGTCQHLIPLYQRTYSWEREQCARLWSDIVKLHNTKREGHFVGSIVRIDEDSAAGSTLAMIIDGQQRLTTLTLLLVALRDYAATYSDCGVNPNKITDTLLLNQYETGNAKYKLLLTQSDRDALIKKIEGAQISDTLKSRVLDNFFRDYLTMKLGRIPRKNEVYKEFRTYHNGSGLTMCYLWTIAITLKGFLLR